MLQRTPLLYTASLASVAWYDLHEGMLRVWNSRALLTNPPFGALGGSQAKKPALKHGGLPKTRRSLLGVPRSRSKLRKVEEGTDLIMKSG